MVSGRNIVVEGPGGAKVLYSWNWEAEQGNRGTVEGAGDHV